MWNRLDDEKKTLSILDYALRKKNISSDLYYIGHEGDRNIPQNALCLLKKDMDEWHVSFVDQKGYIHKIIYKDVYYAVKYFYRSLTRKDTIWNYHSEWARENSFVENDREANILSLLEYALAKNNISKNGYAIGKEGDEGRYHDTLCLLKSVSGEWIYLYTERGTISEKAIYNMVEDAATDFYWKWVDRVSPWDYRQEWEAATGLEF